MQNKKTISFVLFALIVSISGRLIPHLPGFTPLVAITLFSGYAFKSPLKSLLLSLFCLFLGDVATVTILNSQYITLYDYFFSTQTLFIYGSIVLISLLSNTISEIKLSKIATLGLSGSLIFWILSNLGMWTISPLLYSQNLSGLTSCYIAAIPFLGYQIAGDLFYCSVVFGLALMATNYFNNTQKVRA